MATSRAKKSVFLSSAEKNFKEAKSIAFAKIDRLTVEEMDQVRKEMRSLGMNSHVLKKTLISLAAKNSIKVEFSPDSLQGSILVLTSPHDSIAPFAAIKKFKKDFYVKKEKFYKFDFAGGVFENAFVSAEAATIIADTPTKEESLGRIVGMLKSGPQKLHTVLGSGFQKIYSVLQNAEKFAS